MSGGEGWGALVSLSITCGPPEPTSASGPSGESRPVEGRLKRGGWKVAGGVGGEGRGYDGNGGG